MGTSGAKQPSTVLHEHAITGLVESLAEVRCQMGSVRFYKSRIELREDEDFLFVGDGWIGLSSPRLLNRCPPYRNRRTV